MPRYLNAFQPYTSPRVWRSQTAHASSALRVGLVLLLLTGILSTLVLGGATFVAFGIANQAYEEAVIDADAFTDPGERSSFIYDSAGNLLYELHADKRRYYASLETISPILIEAVLAAEDKNFWSHTGVDLAAISRSALVNLQTGETSTGASTITQQVVKYLHFTDQGQAFAEVSMTRKLDEAALALRLEEQFSKQQILEYYLNNIFLGNGVWGVETAARVFFAKSAAELDLAESALLAGIIQQPTRANPYDVVQVADTTEGQLAAFAAPDTGMVPLYKVRQAYVLDRLVANQNISSGEAEQALAQVLTFQPLTERITHPHFVWFVEQQLIAALGTGRVQRGGLRITTTLNPTLQEEAARMVSEHVAKNRVAKNMTNAALLSLDPRNGHILAMVGGQDYYDTAGGGNVNVITAKRQPGSAIKPLVYAAALENGYGAGSVIADTRVSFGSGTEAYSPQNDDKRFHGYLTFRQALGSSYNVPVVKLLNTLGIPPVIAFASQLGLDSLDLASQYGLSFALGAYEISPLELASAYAVFANRGVKVAPTALLRVTDDAGQDLIDNRAPVGERLMEEGNAYIISDILADNRARSRVFGANNKLKLSRQAAAKSGTSQYFRDNWTIGYVPELLTVVWAGNNDGTPLQESYGSQGAAPLWNQFMERALGLLGVPVSWYDRPPDVAKWGDLYTTPNAKPNKTIR